MSPLGKTLLVGTFLASGISLAVAGASAGSGWRRRWWEE
jgi:hypothetical protein